MAFGRIPSWLDKPTLTFVGVLLVIVTGAPVQAQPQFSIDGRIQVLWWENNYGSGADGATGEETVAPVTPVLLAAYNFEDGRIPPSAICPNKIPASIMIDANGNHFLQVLGSPEDCGSSFSTNCPTVRHEVNVSFLDWSSQPNATYSFSIRVPSANPAAEDILMQLFQFTGSHTSGGPTIWLAAGSGSWRFENRAQGGLQAFDLGPIPFDQWVNFSLDIFWTVDPALGRVGIFMNGQNVGRFTGQATVYTSDPAGTMGMVLNVYGNPGAVDFDNVDVTTTQTRRNKELSGL